MKITIQQLWQQLQQQHLVNSGNYTKYQTVPIFARLLLGLSAWIVSLFLIIFIVFSFDMFGHYQGIFKIVFFLFIFIAGAYMLNRVKNNEFCNQLSLVCSLVSYALFFFLMLDYFKLSQSYFIFAVLIFSGLHLWLITDFLQRLCASLMISAFTFLLFNQICPIYPLLLLYIEVFACLMVVLWLKEFNLIKHWQLFYPVAYAVAIVLAVSSYILVLDKIFIDDLFYHTKYYYLESGNELFWSNLSYCLSWLLYLAAIAFSIKQIFCRLAISLTSSKAIGIIVIILALVVLLYPIPGAVPSMLILVIGFANANRFLVGLGVVAALSYLSGYYYFLQISLLEKSISLILLGVLLLLAYAVLDYFYPTINKESNNA